MENNNIVASGIPLVLFEFFLQEKIAILDFQKGKDVLTVTMDIFLLSDYYERFYISELNSGNIDDETNFFIPIFIDIEKNIVLSIKEIDDLGVISKKEAIILFLDRGNGEEKFEVISFSRDEITKSLINETGIPISTIFGPVYFSVDYFSIILSIEKIIDLEEIAFVIDKECNIVGTLLEPEMSESSTVKILEI